MHMMDMEENRIKHANAQEMWNNVIEANKKAAKDTLGYISRKKSDNSIIKQLSEEQRKLGEAIQSSNNQEDRTNLRKQRNKKLDTLHKKLKEEEERREDREERISGAEAFRSFVTFSCCGTCRACGR